MKTYYFSDSFSIILDTHVRDLAGYGDENGSISARKT